MRLLDFFTDPERAAASAAVTTAILASGLVALSLWLKHRVCHPDPYMQRRKRLIDELYGVSAAGAILVVVTATQLVFLGGLITLTDATADISLDKFRLLVRLLLLGLFSCFLLVFGAAMRVYISKLDILIERDRAGRHVPTELRKALPTVRKHFALGSYIVLQFALFYFITNAFTDYRFVLHF